MSANNLAVRLTSAYYSGRTDGSPEEALSMLSRAREILGGELEPFDPKEEAGSIIAFFASDLEKRSASGDVGAVPRDSWVHVFELSMLDGPWTYRLGYPVQYLPANLRQYARAEVAAQLILGHGSKEGTASPVSIRFRLLAYVLQFQSVKRFTEDEVDEYLLNRYGWSENSTERDYIEAAYDGTVEALNIIKDARDSEKSGNPVFVSDLSRALVGLNKARRNLKASISE